MKGSRAFVHRLGGQRAGLERSKAARPSALKQTLRYMQKHRSIQADPRLSFRSMYKYNSPNPKFEISTDFLETLLKVCPAQTTIA